MERAYVEYPGTWRARLDRVVAPYGAFTRGEFGRRLAELSAESDIIHVHGIGAGAMIPKLGGRAIVQLDCVTRRDRDVGRLWTRDGRIALETLRAERVTLHRARWILASSVPVADELAASAPGALVTYAPLPLDPSQYPDRADLRYPVAGLIGTARWPPTANAVERLLTRVWPLVLRARPDAELVLAGRGMERASFPHLPSPSGVRWLGEVDSAEAFLQSLGLLLYPLQRGSGAKVKVLESMLMGIPVVTTPEGAEGLAGDGGVIVENEDQALARAACRLLEDREIRRQLGAEGYARFNAHHAPAVAAAQAVDVYQRMLAGAGR